MFKNEDDFKELISRLDIDNKPNLVHRENLQRQMLSVFNEKRTDTSRHSSFWQIIGRTIMKKPITRLVTATVVIVALLIGLNILTDTKATAAQIFAEAAEAVANLRSVYIQAQMRTIANDNFALMGLDYDFVPVEMWKEFNSVGQGRCRFEKPKRIVVTSGEFESSLLLIKPNHAARGRGDIGSVRWLKRLLDIDKVLDSEIRLAQQQDSELLLIHEKVTDGTDKLVVIVDAFAQGDFSNDWCKNSSIVESDNRRIYRFDAETKLLEDLQVFIYPDSGNEVLVFEITDIAYNIDIDPALFTIELPDDVIWYGEPKELVDNEKYQQMTPKEMARAFFQACADEDWDEFSKFFVASEVDQRLKNILGGLEIISIGEPFKSGLYPGWFVPYEIRFKYDKENKKMNLAVRNDNTANRYIVDGGF